MSRSAPDREAPAPLRRAGLAPLLALVVSGCASHAACESSLRDLETKRASAQEEAERLRASVAALDRRLEEAGAAADARASALDALVMQLRDRLEDVEKVLGSRREPPAAAPGVRGKPAKGKVLAANAEMDLYLLSVGKTSGVLPGDEFTVYRGDQFVAVVVIDKVYEDKASCFVKKVKDNPFLQSAIRLGDSFATIE